MAMGCAFAVASTPELHAASWAISELDRLNLVAGIIIEGDSLMIIDWLQRGGGSVHPLFLKILKRTREMRRVRFEAKRSPC